MRVQLWHWLAVWVAVAPAAASVLGAITLGLAFYVARLTRRSTRASEASARNSAASSASSAAAARDAARALAMHFVPTLRLAGLWEQNARVQDMADPLPLAKRSAHLGETLKVVLTVDRPVVNDEVRLTWRRDDGEVRERHVALQSATATGRLGDLIRQQVALDGYGTEVALDGVVITGHDDQGTATAGLPALTVRCHGTESQAPWMAQLEQPFTVGPPAHSVPQLFVEPFELDL